jgi:hypothetical protein
MVWVTLSMVSVLCIPHQGGIYIHIHRKVNPDKVK